LKLDEIFKEVSHEGVMVTITRSEGEDNAIVVFVDTAFEPDGSDGGPGLRILLNDDDAYVGVPHRPFVEEGEDFDVLRRG
jgi:hypothetical protein